MEAPELSLYQKKIFTGPDGKTWPYRILYPKGYAKGQSYPLVLFLHGVGERGDDNEKPLKHGARLFLQEKLRNDFPCLVVFPQCPETGFWGSVNVDFSKTPVSLNFDYSHGPSPSLKAVMGMVAHTVKEENCDASRVYIMGISMGGMGTFEAVYQYPNTFAAAIPICGGGDALRYDERILPTAFWVFHGDQDEAVDVKYSRVMAEKLKALKAVAHYTEYPGVDHHSWDNAFAEPELLPWLFSHRLGK